MNFVRSISTTSKAIEYPHTNWYHDQGMLRLTLPKRITETASDLRFEFDYSSFLKIYIYQPRKKKEEFDPVFNVNDIINFMDRAEDEYSTFQLTITIGIGYPPEIFIYRGNGNLHKRVHTELPGEANWKNLVQSSNIQVKLSFDSEQGCRNFISHLHSAVSCPIIFLSNPLEIQPSDIPLIPPNISSLPWENPNMVDGKIDDALAFLAAIHANLKLQPMMEVIEIPRPITVNFGDDFVLMRTVIITPTRKICCPPMQLMSSRAFRILGGAEKFIQVKFRDENMAMMKRDNEMMAEVVLSPGLDGINIAGKMFFDLARSNSMFREHGSYFYQTENQNEIVKILKSLGNFKPEPSSKTSARVGQYFTSAREVKHKLESHEYTVIPDYISDATNSKDEPYCFSDGVGIISMKFANSIKEEFNLAYLPSAFQIRCLGFKGVLSIDHRHPMLIDSGGDKLVLFRESQKKFDVPNSMEVVLGIVKHSAPASVRFNKPLINLWDQV
uniref:RNA-dependent RNA polymerase n=1 Tax=Panagrolaimus superbus TaxID=310955 RepID=A0A914XVN6_9BILA